MAGWHLAVGPFSLNIVDVVVLAIAVLAAVVGSVKGFAREFSSRVGLLVGAIIALYFSNLGTPIILNTFDISLFWATVIAFVAFFVGGFVVVMVIGFLLEKTLTALKLGWLDKILGFVLGIVEFGVVLALLLFLAKNQKVVNVDDYVNKSIILTKVIGPLSEKTITFAKGLLNG
ncbi:MAG: CvpA family protein [Sphaerochaetaceae bacterium]|jgi:membrane protein required for colicin V production